MTLAALVLVAASCATLEDRFETAFHTAASIAVAEFDTSWGELNADPSPIALVGTVLLSNGYETEGRALFAAWQDVLVQGCYGL